MSKCKKLRDPHLNVSAVPADGELAKALDIVGNEEPVSRLAGLRSVLDELGACRAGCADEKSRTLDLIAHSDRARLLRLGESLVDPSEADVRRFFEMMAADRILQRLRIREVRLLGCETAMSSEGQAAIRDLTEILGVRVVGTSKLVYAAYFDDKGLKRRYEQILRSADRLPELSEERLQWPQNPRPAVARRFDLEAIETVAPHPPAARSTSAPRPLVKRITDARPLADLIDPDDGRVMPRMLARPQVELLVGREGEELRKVEVLFDFELVKVRPADGSGTAVYRVQNPDELAAWIDSNPSA